MRCSQHMLRWAHCAIMQAGRIHGCCRLHGRAGRLCPPAWPPPHPPICAHRTPPAPGTGQNNFGLNWGNGFITDSGVINAYSLSDPRAFFEELLAKPYVDKVCGARRPAGCLQRWFCWQLAARSSRQQRC